MINFIISFIDYFDKLRILKFFKKNLDDNKINVIDIELIKVRQLIFLNNFNVNKILFLNQTKKLFSKIKKRFVDRRIHLFNLGVGFKNERKFKSYYR